ncbi:dimethyl sulfoxide reductase anchor subunit family protein [Egicoccus halophilus]|uniref:DMSO reductase subunit C n=1 Tax=Egicoccus halophilus TaxID=1670830 RepID=A0A8J3A5W7_9ACTN|nr:DmsC/YnfH family molybdoenzyme membrane anchor subunit [Egicoccus halophilus]GGI03578.1 DMSO reductase subunit C [Egicoccus halophilus]
MPAFDWPLTVFTLITQLVLGAFAVLWVTDLLARQLADTGEQEELTSVGVWLLGPLMALGFVASTLHLGQPMHAYRALFNLGNSWLSREILFLGGFFALGGLYAALWWRYRDRFPLRATLGAVAGVAGALGLASMTMLYLVPAMPSWYQLSTPLSFVASALVLGPLLVAAVFLTIYARRRTAGSLEPLLGLHLRAMAVTVLAGALLSAASLLLKLGRLPALGLEGEASLALFTVDHRWLLALRAVGWIVGVALVVVLLQRLRTDRLVYRASPLVWGMLVAFGASELVGRLLFYATAVPLRPPGSIV